MGSTKSFENMYSNVNSRNAFRLIIAYSTDTPILRTRPTSLATPNNQHAGKRAVKTFQNRANYINVSRLQLAGTCSGFRFNLKTSDIYTKNQ